jgi:transcriptional regulator of met regulon
VHDTHVKLKKKKLKSLKIKKLEIIKEERVRRCLCGSRKKTKAASKASKQKEENGKSNHMIECFLQAFVGPDKIKEESETIDLSESKGNST